MVFPVLQNLRQLHIPQTTWLEEYKTTGTGECGRLGHETDCLFYETIQKCGRSFDDVQ